MRRGALTLRARAAVGRRVQARLGEEARIPFGPLHGFRLHVLPDEPLDLRAGFFEYELAPHVRRLCVEGRPALDVGAHSGYYTLWLARLCRSTVVAFDPDPRSQRVVERNRRLNPEIAAFVEIAPLRLGARPGEGRESIDHFLAQRPGLVPGFVKIDVDGDELAVLEGSRELCAAHRPGLLVETHSAELERGCGELLLSLGYRVRVVTQRRRLAQRRVGGFNRWLVAEHA